MTKTNSSFKYFGKHSHYAISLPLLSKVVLAIMGSYILANLVSIAFLALPITPISALAWGKTTGVLVCVLAVVYIFSVSARRAWGVIMGLNILLYALCIAVFGSIGL